MRTWLRVGLALLMALGLATTADAQVSDRGVSFNAAVGPSFASLGTTLSTTAALEVKVSERVGLLGEFGVLPHAPFRDAAEIAPPLTGADARRVNAYHWNGNIRVRPFEHRALTPYLTAGVGSFTADAVGEQRTIGGVTIEDRRRVSDLATNVGAGTVVRLNDWLGVNADYRTFFVHRDGDDPRVHRFTTGLSFFLP